MCYRLITGQEASMRYLCTLTLPFTLEAGSDLNAQVIDSVYLVEFI